MKTKNIAIFIIISIIAIFAGLATIELLMGRSFFGPDGQFGLWTSSIWSNEQSQRLADPYSLSHIIHGLAFYAFLIPLCYHFARILRRQCFEFFGRHNRDNLTINIIMLIYPIEAIKNWQLITMPMV